MKCKQGYAIQPLTMSFWLLCNVRLENIFYIIIVPNVHDPVAFPPPPSMYMILWLSLSPPPPPPFFVFFSEI